MNKIVSCEELIEMVDNKEIFNDEDNNVTLENTVYLGYIDSATVRCERESSGFDGIDIILYCEGREIASYIINRNDKYNVEITETYCYGTNEVFLKMINISRVNE